MENDNERLPLGEAETAVQSCVSLIAAVCGQRENVLAYWLDLYYQVRRAYEIEQDNEPDPKLLRAEDLYPVMREFMRELLKDTAKNRARKTEGDKEPKQTPAEFKRAVLEKLQNARAAGVSIAAIAEATKGGCTEAEVRDILACHRVRIGAYEELNNALADAASLA